MLVFCYLFSQLLTVIFLIILRLIIKLCNISILGFKSVTIFQLSFSPELILAHHHHANILVDRPTSQVALRSKPSRCMVDVMYTRQSI
jgi:hypothetical protein